MMLIFQCHKLSCFFPNEMCDRETLSQELTASPWKATVPTSGGNTNSQNGCMVSKSAFLKKMELFGSFLVDEQRFGHTFLRLSIIDSQMDYCNFPETDSNSSWKWTVEDDPFLLGWPMFRGRVLIFFRSIEPMRRLLVQHQSCMYY